MTDQNNNSPPNGPTSRRRSSFAGQAFADLFGGGRNRSSTIESSTSPPTGQYSGPIASAAAQANQRRLSLTTSLGLGSSPPQGGAFFGGRARGDSISSSNNASVDESAVEDEPASAGTSQPTTPFARRVSFGARALRDMNKSGGGGSNGNNGEPGFNWADNMRTRAERTSIGGAAAGGSLPQPSHHRAKSVAVMEQPIREAPKPARVLDHTQERILKGDFYMD